MKNKISLFTAILININIIVGSAFFIGAKDIAINSGKFAPLTWILFGLTLLPLILVLSDLSKIYPHAGGLYVYSKKQLGSFGGFLSGWGYYIGAIAGNAIIMHKFSERINEFFQNLFQPTTLNLLSMDIFFISLFTIFNLLNINFLEKLQFVFTSLKSIPILILLLSSFYLFSFENVVSTPMKFDGFIDSVPLVLFAYFGFEACCAIGHQIENGAKNTSKAILISFFLIMLLYSSMQFSILGIFGATPTAPFLDVLPKLTSNNFLIFFGNKIINLAIISSFLGGFYSMFYANNWNLYAIAKEKQLPFSDQLIKTNKNNVPHISIIIQGILVIIFLLITQSTSYLISMSDFGGIIAYLLSTISFLLIYKFKNWKKMTIGILSVISCSYLLWICTQNLLVDGLSYLLPFLIIIFAGIILYKFKKQ
ncbi:MAG: APC family permease [bacterium]